MASTILGLDKSNNQLTPVYTYADTRSYKELADLKSKINQKYMMKLAALCIRHTSLQEFYG